MIIKDTHLDGVRIIIPNRKYEQGVISYENWARIILCDFAELHGTTHKQLLRYFNDFKKKGNKRNI